MTYGTPFNREEFLRDVRANAKEIVDGKLGRFSDSASLFFHLLDLDEVNALAKRTASDQYMIVHYIGLANRLFDASDTLASYCLAHFDAINTSRDQYARLIAGISSEMVFWHEYSHLMRGHLAFLKANGIGDGIELYERAPSNAPPQSKCADLVIRRFVETDADIYGARLLFGRCFVNMQANKIRLSKKAWMLAYVLGIRSMFEVLYDPSEEWMSNESDHPHSVVRAYIAIAHGVATAGELGLTKDDQEEWMRTAIDGLLQFELILGRPPLNVELLERFRDSELKHWAETEGQLIYFQTVIKKPKRSLCNVLRRILTWQ